MERLRATYAAAQDTTRTLTVIHQWDADGRDYDLHLPPGQWTAVDGRPGVWLFPVPHPFGGPVLWMMNYYVLPGSEYTGAHIAERRRVAVTWGELECNGRRYVAGECFTIDAHESTAWRVSAGVAGAVFYETCEPETPANP